MTRYLVACALISTLACGTKKDEEAKKVEVPAKKADTLPLGRIAPVDLVADDLYLYFTNSTGTVMRTPKDGSAPAILAKEEASPGLIAVDATHVYWSTQGGLMRAPKTGGVKEPVAEFPEQISDIAAADGTLYFTQRDKGTVMKVTPGTPPVALATGVPQPTTIAVEPLNLFFVAGGKVMKVSRDGGQVTDAGDEAPAHLAALARAAGDASQAVADADFVYLAGKKALRRVPKAGGTPVDLVLTDNIGSIAVDDQSIFWTEYAKQRIQRVAK